jgi:hypothetical protein
MEPIDQQNDEAWEEAVAGRLSKLRSMPVETGRLAAALQAQIPNPAARQRRTMWMSLRSVRAVAASLLLLGTLAAVFVFATMSRPALASPAQMARMHEELVAGTVGAVQVDSIEAANLVLAGEHPQFPALPSLPADHVMACCMTSVKDKKVACVLMKREGVPVSLMVARSRDMRVPESPVTVRNGVSYHIQASGRLNMVMTERHGRWVCLIGELPAERLMDVASQLKF